MIPRTLVMQLQKQPEFHRWVKFAQPRGDSFQLQLREFVDGQRLAVKITEENFRKLFQITLDDSVAVENSPTPSELISICTVALSPR
jgi:hypothetical protein